MKFILIDKIDKIETGKEIQTVKNVSLSEEYLGDHFPIFPVLPGVFLLQGLIESGCWLVRHSENFAHSMVLLTQAKNVKYKSFAAPGMNIRYTVTAKSIEETVSSFSAVGTCDGQPIVEARFGLRHFNLAERDPKLVIEDGHIISKLKERFRLLASGSGAA
ncbi:MAG: 3-hydroxyacyl-(acyl-carrier-protein) dehydratase FabZ [Planctomycetes bacterium ADurb.Bin401]|nr:MAG: 3-hydroxyacyl-(acyl-carrier-protein) dehydratase FabZ [Planctomycetes bacterium ADurb.Bin401]